jgi:hypothetical protein
MVDLVAFIIPPGDITYVNETGTSAYAPRLNLPSAQIFNLVRFRI